MLRPSTFLAHQGKPSDMHLVAGAPFTGGRRLLAAALAALLLLVSAYGHADAAPPDRVHFWLTVLHNNDAESKLLNPAAGLEDYGGVARFAARIDDLRSETLTGPRPAGQRGAKRGVVTLSSGDNFLAGPEFSASLDRPDGGPFYDSIAMDLIGYDAITLGNHEFDFGPNVLAEFIGGTTSEAPFLSANLDFSGEPSLQSLVDSGRIASSTMIVERGERIGIIGATTERLASVSSPRNVTAGDVVTAVQAEVETLSAAGAQIIILSSHLQDVNQEVAVVAELSGVDIVIAGGGGELLANEGDLLVPDLDAAGDLVAPPVSGPYPVLATDGDGVTVPIVTTNGNYEHIGRLIAGFDRHGKLVTIAPESGPVRVSGVAPDAVAPDATVQALVTDPVATYVAALAAEVIGVSQVALDGRRSTIRSVETNLGNLVADSLLWQANQLAGGSVPAADVSFQNGGGIRNESIIPPGEITELDTFRILAFTNFVVTVPDVPAAQFVQLLNHAVNGSFVQVGGFRMTYTAARAGSRAVVTDVILDDGTVLMADGTLAPGAPSVTIATIDFLARGGSGFPFGGAAFISHPVTYQQALSGYIQAGAAQGGLGGVISSADYPEVATPADRQRIFVE